MKTANSNKLLQFEGLRGFAALIVFFSHIKNTFFVTYSESLILYLKSVLHNKYLAIIFHSFVEFFFNGFVAVYIFWIMSAYVLTMSFFKMDSDKIIAQLQNSVSKRYFRLMIPAGVSIMISYSFMKIKLFYNMDLTRYNAVFNSDWQKGQFSFQPDLLIALRTIFWDTFFNFEFKTTYNFPLWTMSPEFFGSLFCFCSIAITHKNNKRYLFYFLSVLISILCFNKWLLAFTLGILLSDYNNTFHDENSIAMKIKRIETRFFEINALSVISILLVIILIGLGDFYQLAYLFEGFLIVYLTLNSKYLAYFFSTKPLVFLGKISFSLYLIHMIVIFTLTCYIYLHLPMLSNVLRIIIATAISLAALLILSNWFTIFIDKFALTISGKIGKYYSAKNN